MCKQTRCCKLSLHERHRKYVWSDINKCSPPVAVTAGIAGANLISQGEVSLVVWRGGVGWGGGSSPCTTVNTRYILIRCHRGVWSARENLSRIPGREWAEGGEQRKRAVTREQGGGADGSGGGWRRVCPLAVSVAYLSLSLPLPLTSLPSSCFSSILSVATCSTHFRCIKSPLYVWYFHSEENRNRSCHARASQPPTKLPKRKKQTKS